MGQKGRSSEYREMRRDARRRPETQATLRGGRNEQRVERIRRPQQRCAYAGQGHRETDPSDKGESARNDAGNRPAFSAEVEPVTFGPAEANHAYNAQRQTHYLRENGNDRGHTADGRGDSKRLGRRLGDQIRGTAHRQDGPGEGYNLDRDRRVFYGSRYRWR